MQGLADMFEFIQGSGERIQAWPVYKRVKIENMTAAEFREQVNIDMAELADSIVEAATRQGWFDND